MNAPQEPEKQPDNKMTTRQAYNVVSDTVTGVNIRPRDNLYQGLAILICLVLGAGIGCLVVADRLRGAVGGGLVGVLVGLFGSGLYLMIYRAIKHARGEHD
jgi:hypothetical protein